MKQIKLCVIITPIFQIFFLFKIIACEGYIIDKTNQFFIHKRIYKNVDSLKIKKRYNCIKRFCIKYEDDIRSIETALLNVNEEKLRDVLKEEEEKEKEKEKKKDKENSTILENKADLNDQETEMKTKIETNTKTKLTTAEKKKNEIEQIRKKSESILLERSFSFNKEQIQIKPELLKELITQKYRKMFQRHEKDCGSSEIQIIILTFKIFFLTEHMKRHKKDFACLRGLFKCVSKRRRLLKYLGTKNRDVFERITDFFKIKKPLLPKTPEYYSKKLKYVYFNNTKRFKNNEEKKKKDKLKKKNVQSDKILFTN